MAPRFPSPVTFYDNDPNSGYFKIFLTLDEMTLSWWPIFGSKRSNNTVFNDKADMFQMNTICVIGTVTTDDGMIEYVYQKRLPEEINPAKCNYKLSGKKIILTVCKAEKVPWSQHFEHFITPN